MPSQSAASRRLFLQSSIAVAALGGIARAQQPDLVDTLKKKEHALKLGVATYTLRGIKLDDAIAAIVRVGLKYCSIKDKHLPRNSTAEERKAIAAKFKAAGITPLSCGTVEMQNDEANIRSAFEYARDAGIPTIVCNPHPDSFAILDRMVKEFDIKLAIHNHGPEAAHFKSPFDVMKAAEGHDERIGLCIDVGHTFRMKVDPADAIRKLAARLYDCHLKDISEISVPAKNIEIGRGILDPRSILQALLDVKFTGHAGIEYEKAPDDPVPGLAESVGYVKGVLGCIA
jgi:sugar phosphate isomerase/epimerase